MAKVNLSHLAACVEDSRLAWLDADSGPADPTNYGELLIRLEAAHAKLPPLYRTNAAVPFLAALKALGATGFAHILERDPKRESSAG